ncbi:hypothetical protein KR044_012953, partial [Drosophila immigrans]
NRKTSKKRSQLAERIADSDELVRQLKQLQGNQQQLNDLRRTAGEVTELYQNEKKQREELEQRLNEHSQRCAELEKQLDVQQLNCEQLQEQLELRALPVEARDMVTTFMQLCQRVAEDSPASGLLRREHNLLRKLKDYCKTAKITIPPAPLRSPPSKRAKPTATATQTTQTNALQEAPSKPVMCSIAVQSERLVTTRNQGTQHKNMTTTRGTTTASFIKKHDVGTCFPEPKAPLSVQQILNDMLTWSSSIQRPLSPIGDLQPEPDVVQSISLGTCTDLCNVLREIDYLPEVPADLKRSNSRPPSRASVKDELAAPALGAYGHHMAKELLNILPHNHSVLTDLPPHVFNEIWQVMGQMVLVVLQRRSTNASLATPTPTPPPTISQADFSSWFDALHESSLNLALSSNKGKWNKALKSTADQCINMLLDHAEMDVPAEDTVDGVDAGTDPMMTPPPVVVGNELTPIRLPVRPTFHMKARRKPKPKKKRRRVVIKSKSAAKTKQSESVFKTADAAESAVHFLSNLNVFTSSNCDISDIQLDQEEQQLLAMASAAENAVACIGNKESTSGQKPWDDKQPNLKKTNKCTQSTSIISEEDANDRQLSPLADAEDRLHIMHTENISAKSAHTEQVESSLNKDNTSKDGEVEEDLSKSVFSDSSYKTQMTSLFGTDEDSDDAQVEEGLPSCPSINSSRDKLAHNIDFNSLSQSEEEGTDEQLYEDAHHISHPSISSLDSNSSLADSDDEQPQLLVDTKDLQESCPTPFSHKVQRNPLFYGDGNFVHPSVESCSQIHVSFSDVDSIESDCGLVIDDLDEDTTNTNEAICNPTRAFEAIEPAPAAKRKRKASSSSSLDCQPVEKRLTRFQAKQLLLESATNVNIDNIKSLNASEDTEFCSPMSPVAAADCEGSDCDAIEIPLQSPGEEHNASEPKALLSYVVNEVKANAKQCGKRQQLPQLNHSQMEQLKLIVVKYMSGCGELDSSCFECFIQNETVAFDVIINAYATDVVMIENVSALERLLLAVRRIELQCNSFVQRLMNALEQRLFTLKERLNTQTSRKCLRLYLHLIGMQRNLTVPGQSFVNPARLLLAKILYHYKNDMTLLVLEVLVHFPTVLPYREERDYNHADPLITVIKHLLMGHKYEVQDAEGADRELLSKLRFQYHFQPFEPTKQQVIDNLVEKLKAGRLNQLCYAFALLCRRATPTQVINSVLDTQLLPLANSYCDLCMQSEEYDARMEVLLQSISMIVKQMPLGQQINISTYIALFKRILVAVPRPGVQQAAVQAILRTQRFGYGFALDALQSYRPNYPLSPMTRAMMRSYAERRSEYQLARKPPNGPKI